MQSSSGPAAGGAAAGDPGDGAPGIAAISRLDGRRVAIVNWRDPWHPDAGGAEQHAWEIAKGLAARGAAVRYVTARPPGSRRREHRDGVQIARMGGRFTVYPRVLAWMLARRRWPDAVVDVQNGIPFFTPWVLPRRVPVLCVMHHVHDGQWGAHFPGWAARIGRVLEGPVARRCYRRHACVAVSPSTVTAMRERLRWPGPVYLIPNGISVRTAREGVSKYSLIGAGPGAPEPERGPAAPGAHEREPEPGPGEGEPEPGAREGEPEGGASEPEAGGSEPGLVWVGRLVAHKRAERLAGIAERLRGSGATIDVVGQGPEAGRLAAEIGRRDLGGVLRMRGYLPAGEKESLVASSWLHLSTSQGEGWGLSVLEAAALGVPTVAYDVDGLRDAVQHGSTGWLVGEGERIEDVVERALKELTDPARRARMAEACAGWAAQFDWDRAAGRFAALLGAAIRTGSAQGTRPGAWVIEYPGAGAGRRADAARGAGAGQPESREGAGVGSPRSAVAEGPVFDVLIQQAGSGARVRPATGTERLLGRTDSAAWR